MQCPRVALAHVLAQAPERAEDRMAQMEQTRFVSHSTWHQAEEASKLSSKHLSFPHSTLCDARACRFACQGEVFSRQASKIESVSEC